MFHVYLLFKKKEVITTKKNYRELEFTEGVSPSFMDKTYLLLIEDEDTTDTIFGNKQFISQYKKIEKPTKLFFSLIEETTKISMEWWYLLN